MKKYKCSNCEDGNNLDETCTCWDCGREGTLVKIGSKYYKQLEKPLNELTNKERKKVYKLISLIVGINLDIERSCNE
jgi:hypothetical protein